MKHLIISSFAVLAGLLMLACGDTANYLNSVAPATGARVKFYHVASDLGGIDIYLNEQKISGVNTVAGATPTSITYGSTFPNQDYAMVTPGTAKMNIILPASTTATSTTTLSSSDLTTQADTYYSVFLYGISPNYSILTLTDNLTPADASKAYIRLLNFVSGAEAGATYDLVVNGAVVSTGIAPSKNSATFVAIPAIGYATTAIPVQIRPTGATTVTAATTLQPYAGRSYTFVVRGVVGGTGTKAITLSPGTNANVINR